MTKLYDLIQKRRGKELVVMTDSFTRVRQRKADLMRSQRGGIGINSDKVSYEIRESVETVKYKKKATGYYA